MRVMSEWRAAAKIYLKKPDYGNIKQAYLELTGETEPQSSSLPELKVEGTTGSYIWSAPDAHIYEYLWTISLTGEPGVKKEKKEVLTRKQKCICWLKRKFFPKRDWVDLLRKKDAVLIQLIFHTYDTPYLIRVLTTTLKPPLVIKRTLSEKVREALTATKKIGKIAQKGAPKEFGTLLDAIGILEADSVPSYHAYPWYSKTFTALEKNQEKGLEGVEFRIDRRAFKNLGNRIMGSVGLMFICKSENSSQRHPPIKIEARARLLFRRPRTSRKKRTDSSQRKRVEIWIPEKKGSGEETYFFERLFLKINPKRTKINPKRTKITPKRTKAKKPSS